MSHELRTPLNAVIGYSEILLEDELGRENKTKMADLHRINSAGKHLLSLVTDVLDLSKIESDTTELAIEAIDLAQFAQQICVTMRPLAEQSGNKLVLTCEGDLGDVETDPTKLRQVIINLLSNAAKFTREGKITMTVLRTEGSIGRLDRNSRRGYRNRDRSIGFPKLFRISVRPALRHCKSGGTGLGLAISQKLCGLMGGGISCISELGRGSTFVVRIPARLSRDLLCAEQTPDRFEPLRPLAAAAL